MKQSVRLLYIICILGILAFCVYLIRNLIVEKLMPGLTSSKWYLKPDTSFTIASAPPSLSSQTVQKIPRIIHQTSKSAALELQEFETCVINREMNPEYEYRFHTDKDVQQFVQTHFPDKANLFESVLPGAFRADLFRYMVLYIHGGVYMDCKSSTITPLRQFMPSDATMVSFLDWLPGTIQISFLAATPRHPVIEKCLHLAFDRISRREYGKNPLDITGPQICGRALNTCEGRDSLAPLSVGTYTKTGTVLLGGMKMDGTGYQVLTDAKDFPLISRACGSYYHRNQKTWPTSAAWWNHYGVRWMLGRVYKERNA